MAGRSSISLDLERFRFSYEEDREHTKPNGKPILRSNDFGLPAFETGYDVVNVIGNPETASMVCTICLGLPRYPVELRKCGHVFCFLCSMRNINFQPGYMPSAGAPCPNCKRQYLSSSIVEFKRSSQALQNIYNGFDVRCVYGCGHICSPTAMLEHETWACPLRPVGCIFERCGVLLNDTAMEAHLDVCPKRMVFCSTCFLPRKFDGTGHNCLRSTRTTIRGMKTSNTFLKIQSI